MRNPKLVPYETIVRATSGEPEAVDEVLRHYGKRIRFTMSQIVVEDDEFIRELMEALSTQTMPVWDFQGSLLGRNGSEERVIYRDCIPSGQVDIQNVSVGDVIKRNWNFFVNRAPKLQSLLSIDN